MAINNEIMAKAKEAKSPEELMALAKENGVYKGRKPIVCAGFDSVFMLWHRREITAVEAQKRLGLSPSTFYRKVREYEKQIGKGEET